MAQSLKSTSPALHPDRSLAEVASQSRTQPALQAGMRIFTLGDILDAAEWRGDLTAFREGWIGRQACAVAAATLELEPTAQEVEAAVDEFRYPRDLISAEECERWLDQRGLEFSHLTEYVSRRLQSALAEADQPAELAVGDQAAFCIDAILSDEFTGWSHQLARRVALALDAGVPLPESAGLAALWPAMEERFMSIGAGLATPERQRRALANQRLGLTHLTLEAAEFDSSHAAREARLCLVEDGVALSATAAANSFSCQKQEAFIDDLPEDWRTVLLSARSGDIVLPPSKDDCHRLLHVLRRREPSLEDEGVRARLNAGMLEQRLQELETRHVRWLIAVEVDK